MNTCKSCEFKDHDGIDHVCAAYFDGWPGHPSVFPEQYSAPNWCPLNGPKRVTREEVEAVIPDNIRTAMFWMHLNTGNNLPPRSDGQVD